MRLPAVLRAIVIALLLGLLAFWLAGGPLFQLELASSDIFFKIRGPLEGDSNIVLVAIDDASFAATGLRWPWPRSYLAQIVNAVAAGRPRVIAIDILLYEASTPSEDLALALALRDAGNVVLVNNITFEEGSDFALQRLNWPIAELEVAAAALGLTNFAPDPDGTVRRLRSFETHDGETLYSWSMQLARLYYGESGFMMAESDTILIGSHPVLLEGRDIRVDFRGPAGSIPYVSAYQVAQRRVDPATFQDKIAILGITSESLHDSYPTPFGNNPPMPGAEINAHAVDTILNDRFIYPLNDISRLAITLLFGLACSGLAFWLRPIGGFVAVTILLGGYLAASAIAFTEARLLMPVVPPLLAGGMNFVAATSIQLYEERRQRERTRSLFERYVAPAAIKTMLDRPDEYLQGQRRELTILFSDIRGFTTLSEQLSPGEVVAILNDYLSAMTEVIFHHQGTIDKFEGDAILAFFNAPLPVRDHASQAVRCGHIMLQRLAEFNARQLAAGRQALQIGIGINTGEVFVGNIGSAQRLDYTVIGDAVNLASRIQDLTKTEGVELLFSESTARQLPADLAVRFVATATVKGRSQPVNLYTLTAL